MERHDLRNYLSAFEDTSESAKIIIPILFDIMGHPRSVVDLGGGIGQWCKVFKEMGGARVICIDDPSIPLCELKISLEDFVGFELSKSLPAPVDCELALCLEVAEHLPKSLSRDIVSFLVNSARTPMRSSPTSRGTRSEHLFYSGAPPQ